MGSWAVREGTYLGMIYRKMRFCSELWPMLSKLEQYSLSPCERLVTWPRSTRLDAATGSIGHSFQYSTVLLRVMTAAVKPNKMAVAPSASAQSPPVGGRAAALVPEPDVHQVHGSLDHVQDALRGGEAVPGVPLLEAVHVVHLAVPACRGSKWARCRLPPGMVAGRPRT